MSIGSIDCYLKIMNFSILDESKSGDEITRACDLCINFRAFSIQIIHHTNCTLIAIGHNHKMMHNHQSLHSIQYISAPDK